MLIFCICWISEFALSLHLNVKSFSELRKRPEDILLVASTNQIDTIHESLRIPGRFSEKQLHIPDEKARESILEKLCENLTLAPGLNLKTLAKLTPGFVAGDLHKYVTDAGAYRLKRLVR